MSDLLGDQKPMAGFPIWGLALVAAAIVGGAYWLGRRSGRAVKGSAPAALAQAAPIPSPAVPPPAPDGGPFVDGGALAAPVTQAATGGHQRLAATLQGSLDQTVEAAAPPGVGAPLAMTVARLLVWWMRPAQDARPGDKVAVVYDTPTGQEPAIVALDYRSGKDGQDHRAYRWQAPGAKFARYYTADGKELEERLVGSPIDDYEQVTSLLRDGRGHKGVDFKTPVGTPVKSPVDGVIVKRNWHWRANGNCLEIRDSASGRSVIFLHLEEVPREMQPGRHVHRGEQVALSGNTGHTTAPHLHYQLMSPSNRVLDPFQIHRTERISLPAADLAAFQKEVARLDGLLAAH